MRRFGFLVFLAIFASSLVAQDKPTPEEQVFARLPRDLQALLAGVPARDALRKVEYARQNLIALGVPNPSPERLRAAVQATLAPRTAVESASAGETSFPRLSPLVPESAVEIR